MIEEKVQIQRRVQQNTFTQSLHTEVVTENTFQSFEMDGHVALDALAVVLC